jgi:hypothetical protein
LPRAFRGILVPELHTWKILAFSPQKGHEANKLK